MKASTVKSVVILAFVIIVLVVTIVLLKLISTNTKTYTIPPKIPISNTNIIAETGDVEFLPLISVLTFNTIVDSNNFEITDSRDSFIIPTDGIYSLVLTGTIELFELSNSQQYVAVWIHVNNNLLKKQEIYPTAKGILNIDIEGIFNLKKDDIVIVYYYTNYYASSNTINVIMELNETPIEQTSPTQILAEPTDISYFIPELGSIASGTIPKNILTSTTSSSWFSSYGKIIFLNIHLSWTNKNSTSPPTSSSISIMGLPTMSPYTLPRYSINVNKFSHLDPELVITALIDTNANHIQLFSYNPSSGISRPLLFDDLPPSGTINLSGFYFNNIGFVYPSIYQDGEVSVEYNDLVLTVPGLGNLITESKYIVYTWGQFYNYYSIELEWNNPIFTISEGDSPYNYDVQISNVTNFYDSNSIITIGYVDGIKSDGNLVASNYVSDTISLYTHSTNSTINRTITYGDILISGKIYLSGRYSTRARQRGGRSLRYSDIRGLGATSLTPSPRGDPRKIRGGRSTRGGSSIRGRGTRSLIKRL